VPLFLETYQQVDQQVRGKMEEMLLTWRTGSPNGRELFGVGPQISIERGIWPSNPAHGSSHSVNAFVSKSQVLSELEFTLRQKERSLQSNPYDTVAQNHINILSQLRRLVEAGVSQEELAQILAQLRTLVRPTPTNAAAPPSMPPKYTSAMPYPPSFTYQQTVVPAGSSLVHPQYPQPHAPIYPNAAQQFQASDNLRPVAINAVAPSTAPPSIPNISGLFEALVKAGVVPATSPPTGAGATAQVLDNTPSQPRDGQGLSDPKVEDARAYRKAILAEDVKFSSAEISRHRPNIVHFLHDRMPVQCKQCGLRFSDTAQGKKAMQEHLDMHFRQNRKASQSVGRGHSRSWFLGVEDWIHDLPYSSGDRDAGPSSRLSNAKAVAIAESTKRDAELRARFVVVPPGDEAKHVTCPICKEVFKSEFNEDDEEWIWKNAIKMIDDKIYHATCHAEALATSGSLTARLRLGFASSRSRSGTPDAPSLRTTPPRLGKVESPSPHSKAGVKRKIEAGITDSQTNGSPPLKKVILASA